MRFNQPVNGTRTLAEPFASAPTPGHIVSVLAARGISALYGSARVGKGSPARIIDVGSVRSAWEGRVFGLLQLSGIAAIVLAFRWVFF